MLEVRCLPSLSEVSPREWNRLWPGANPFVQYAFLRALETSGCTNEHTGWQPSHLCLYRGDQLVGAVPTYLKSHSHGEFVFDYAWAEAYQRLGYTYYPKLLSAIPFTPSAGPRIGVARGEQPRKILEGVLKAVSEKLEQESLSGWHLLFPEWPERGDDSTRRGGKLLERHDVQFHFRNRGYGSFDEFLACLRSSRRKTIRRERREITRAGLSVVRLRGEEIKDSDWDTFFDCYRLTYLKRSGHGGYLNRQFFHSLREDLPEQLMLVIALHRGKIVATSLFLFDEACLYGRYWGALEEHRYLHFECCLYQGIEFCIEQGLSRFDPGTQGEHKLLRGFEPWSTHSFHLLFDERFVGAISEHLAREAVAVRAYCREAAQYLPYRRNQAG